MLNVQLNKFGVRYPNFVLHPFDLKIVPGERVAILGANGAGKSTTLMAIAGRLREYEGRVLVAVRKSRSQTARYPGEDRVPSRARARLRLDDGSRSTWSFFRSSFRRGTRTMRASYWTAWRFPGAPRSERSQKAWASSSLSLPPNPRARLC